MLALIKNNAVLNRLEIIGQFVEGGWVDLPDGSRVSPAVDGWSLRGYELKTIFPAEPVPEGQMIVSISVEIVDGAPKYVHQLAPQPPVEPEAILPTLYAAAAVRVEGNQVSMLEIVAQLQGAVYDEGWLMVFFSQEQEESQYLIFAQTDIPARIEQFKSGGSFELVFSDSNGDPVNPSRVDIQILKVR